MKEDTEERVRKRVQGRLKGHWVVDKGWTGYRMGAGGGRGGDKWKRKSDGSREGKGKGDGSREGKSEEEWK